MIKVVGMKRLIQLTVLLAYRAVRASGILSTAFGRRVSEHAYLIYKNYFETDIEHLKHLVRPGTTVLDIGANIGFFTNIFSQWVTNRGHVIAIEPEPCNVAALKRSIARTRTSNVEIIQAAVAEIEGNLFLSINPMNPADHRLGDEGIPISAVTIDGLMRERGWPLVSLINIDLQGAEPRAIAGGLETISRFHPAIILEVDDHALRDAGFGSNELIDSLRSLGYVMYSREKNGMKAPLSNEEALLQRKSLGYADFIFIYQN